MIIEIKRCRAHDYFINFESTESEEDLGKTIKQIEEGRLVREGNLEQDANHMYGRVKEDALDTIFKLMELKSSDVFIDIGHGIGTPSLQAAYTTGCESKGIELNEARNMVAGNLKEKLSIRVQRLREKDINYEDVS